MKRTHASRPGAPRFLIVADDLTGACDSAVAFAGRGMPIEVGLDRGIDGRSGGICAISTESRDIPEDEAIERVRGAMVRAGEAQEAFKKIDSVFRGNSFAEIRAAVEAFPSALAIMSSAYPGVGRIVKEGRMHVVDGHQNRSIDLREGLSGVGMSEVRVLPCGDSVAVLCQRMHDAKANGCRLVICDAERDEDLRSVVAAARKMDERILWIGSGGLAHALASELPLSEEGRAEGAGRKDGRVVLFIGSDHAATVKQIAAVKRSCAAEEIEMEDVSEVPESRVVILRLRRGVTTEDQIRRGVALLVPGGIGCCVLTGGDTAMAVCRALGVQALRLSGEFAPGLPGGVAVGGVLDGTPVILKSGGFGREDVLCEVADRFTSRKEFA